MQNNVLANKYRPKKIAEIIGQESVTTILKNSIETGVFHHAYIFAGAYGCGKTTSARVLAVSINNPSGTTLDPDPNTETYKSIMEGRHPDVLEIDAASAGSVDAIREIKSNAQYAPINARMKIIIFDEAHRLSGAAAECALKMIEEPPSNTIIILATTDPDKLKDTIHSRCMSLRFNKVNTDKIFTHLKNVADKENFVYEDSAIRVAAKKAKGSIRTSLQNLQTIKTYAGNNKITHEIAINALSAINESFYFDIVDSILKPDMSAGMLSIDSLLSDGRNIGDVLDGLVGHLRNLMIITTCPSTDGLIQASEEEKKKYMHQLSKMPERKSFALISGMISEISNVARQVSFNMNPQIMLETFLLNSVVLAASLKTKE